jgi:hypothetical protein
VPYRDPKSVPEVCQKMRASAPNRRAQFVPHHSNPYRGAMTTTQRSKRAFPRWSAADPACPVHGSPMRLTPMPRPMFTLVSVDDQRSRVIWKCGEPGCPRVEFSPERDWHLAPAPAPIDAQARKAFRDRCVTIRFGDDE